ncbi:twin-arginine translocation signal domain-containing protein [Burkholderia gladioli pv. gladioli]|uniref:twin-arginine translocation signal domain-containing protein n=1 Tax=Burkholderia gladioli TaxID=28095 RepID=UPI00064971B4|nr:twin-arginine translocation signal domain-containing protein [Burkholderia gladioli]MDJ1161417.1 twin-arginine translocation signal domain-containing protein [Burkholderia gladioli pv. gladioli]MDN7715926.1 twin-arginine translocation signal domain-containing protein [Burkholderia gladioli]
MKGKTIGIARQGPAEAEGPRRIALTRRELLKGSGVLIGTLALSSSLAALAPSRVWALELQGLDTHQGAVLLALTRQIYPHPTLDDAVYALVVKDLDAKARKDAATRRQLAEGVRQLDAKAADGDWTKQDGAAQAKDTAALAGTPFFETVRSTAVVSLYSNGLAYRHFGYGAAEGDGGYLFKGFDDLSWLPDPAPQDSGPVPAA